MKSISLKLLLLLLCCSFTLFAQNQTSENNGICMDPIVGYGTYINGTNTGLCVGCTATDGANTVDGNLSNYSVLTTGISLLGGGSAISVKDSLQYYPGGNVVGFVVSAQGGLLTAAALGNLQIRTYRNGTLVETATTSGSVLKAAVLGGASSGKQMVSFTTTQPFDEVQLYAASVLTALTTVRVYYAYEGPGSCAVDCAVPLLTSGGYSMTTGAAGVCLLSPPTNDGNATDANLTNSSNLSIAVGIACTKYIEVANNSVVIPAGTEAGFVISDGSGLISASLLAQMRIQTYNAAGILQDDSQGGPVLGLTLLSGTAGSYRLGIKTTKSFSRIRITVGGTVTLLFNTNVFYAYIETDTDGDGMPDCLDKCAGGNDLQDTDGDGQPDACDLNQANVGVSKTNNASGPLALNDNVTFTITLTNTSTTNPVGIKIMDLLPAGLTYSSHTAPTGTQYNPVTGIWNVGSALQASGQANDDLSLQIVATATARGVLLNVATIQAMVETNLNSATSASSCVTIPEQLCEASTLVLHAPVGLGSYQWFRNDTLIVGATDSLYTVTTAGNYTVNVTTSTCPTGNCCPVIVEMLARPLASLVPITVCSGTPTTISSSTSTAGDTYLWTTGATTASISVSPLVSAIYNVTKTNLAGCSNTDTISITVNQKPTLTGAIAMCNNNGTVNDSADDIYTFTLSPSGGSGTTYSVSGAGFTTLTNQSYGVRTADIAGTPTPFTIAGGNRTITITDANGCTLADAVVAAPASCSSCLPAICIPITITKN